jgi:hypothetical protein
MLSTQAYLNSPTTFPYPNMSTENLLDHFKLEAEVSPGRTLHVTYKINRARGERERIEKQWDRMDRIGEGTFGQVWRELHRGNDGRREVRAVKIIGKERMRAYNVDFKKELLALAKFSKAEVFNVLLEGYMLRYQTKLTRIVSTSRRICFVLRLV